MKKILIIVAFTIARIHCDGQNTIAIDVGKIANTPSKSASSYQALTQFLQANVSSGTNGGYELKATLFTFDKLFSKDSLNASSIYLLSTNKIKRNLEFSQGIHKGSNGDLNIFTLGIKYAIVNHRDKSEENFASFGDGLLQKDLKIITEAKFYADSMYVNSIQNDNAKIKAFNEAKAKAKKSGDFNDFPSEMADIYKQYLRDRHIDPDSYWKTFRTSMMKSANG